MKRDSTVKRSSLIVLFCMAVLTLAGCWNRVEINDVALVEAAAIDKTKDGKIELTVQNFIPRALGGGQGLGGGGGGGGAAQTFTRSAKGKTIAEAMSVLQEKFPRKIFWGQTEVFLIGEKLAREGIQKEIEFLARHPDPHLRVLVIVSKGKAADALDLHPPLERSSSEVLREMAKSRTLLQVTVKDLLQMLTGDAGAAALPWIEIIPTKAGEEKKSTVAYISGTAIFKKDKMVGHIDDTTTRGLLWLRNEIKSAVVTVTPNGAEGFISLMLIKAKTELIPQIKNDKWQITLKAVSKDDLIQNASKLDVMKPEIVKRVEVELNKDIEIRVNTVLEQVQKKMKADAFGFAEAFHRKYPKEWKKAKEKWDEIFPEVEVNYDIQAKVLRPGKSSRPAGLPEQEVIKK